MQYLRMYTYIQYTNIIWLHTCRNQHENIYEEIENTANSALKQNNTADTPENPLNIVDQQSHYMTLDDATRQNEPGYMHCRNAQTTTTHLKQVM